jgi:micrococcal nuclease
VDVNIDLGFDTWLANQRVRLVGIDAPETRSRDDAEKYFGNLARRFVENVLPLSSRVVLTSEEYNPNAGKYGRIIGDFKVYDAETDRWTQLTDLMVQNHHAVKYREGAHALMEQDHLDNRRKLIQNGVATITLQEAGLV